MKYTDTAYEKAQAVLLKRRHDSEDELERRTAYVYEKLPETKQLQNNIKSSYLELLKIIASRDPNAKQAAELVRDKNLASQERIATLVQDLTGDPDYLKPRHFCPDCGDTGYVNGELCHCFDELMKKFTVEELNLKSTIALHDFSEYRPEYYEEGECRNRMNGYLRYLMNYCNHFPQGCRSLLFMGQTGLGKTFLSACTAKALTERGFVAAFASASDLLRMIENEHFGRSDGSTLDTLLNADIVIIDDLGSEFQTPFHEATLYNIINGRINLRRPTIISTNLTEAQFNARYNERISSRVFNDYIPFLFAGKDIRQQKANKLYGRK